MKLKKRVSAVEAHCEGASAAGKKLAARVTAVEKSFDSVSAADADLAARVTAVEKTVSTACALLREYGNRLAAVQASLKPSPELTGEELSKCNDAISIRALGERGAGNAHHHFRIRWPDGCVDLHFQNGPIKEAGVNGITNETLLTIVLDRLRGFQGGRFACEANERAYVHLEEALTVLKERTRDRVARGVEGTHQQ